MATLNRSGPNSAANPSHGRPGKGNNTRHAVKGRGKEAAPPAAPPVAKTDLASAEALLRARLPDLAGACIEVAREHLAAEAKAQADTPASASAPPGHAEALADIARRIRSWGSVGLFGEADQLDAIAQALAGEPCTKPAAASAEWVPDAERVSLARDALFQALQVADLLIGELDKNRHDESPLHLALTVRVRELADATDLLLTEPDAFDEEEAVQAATRAMFGSAFFRRSTTEGAAS
jgi:hypothetical protein